MINYDIQLKVATTQIESVWYDAHETITKMIGFVEEAANNGAKLIAFPECFIPGYFYHIWTETAFDGLRLYDMKLMQNSLELDGPEMKRIMRAAKENNINIVTGYVERCGASRYMSQVIISNEGEILVNRRKLKPTHAERTISGEGTGADLKVVKTPYGIVGTTECWEHTQPLITYAMASMNEQIHIASWPATAFDNPGHLSGGSKGPITLTRTYTMQTQTYTLLSSGVIGDAAVNFFCGDNDVKKKILGRGAGIARIFDPEGTDLCEHLPEDEEGIIYADIDLNNILRTKAMLDPVGHYSRPDIFCLHINKSHNPFTKVTNEPEGVTQVDAVNAAFENEIGEKKE